MNCNDRAQKTKIRVGAAQDIDSGSIEQLLREASLPVPQAAENVSFLVARKNGTICGCLGWERYENVALLRSLTVAPTDRIQGIASHLVQTAIDELRAHGIGEFYLLTETAAAFAERFGFSAVDRCSLPSQLQRSTQINTGCCSSAKCMRLVV